jgi:hypothetical protein
MKKQKTEAKTATAVKDLGSAVAQATELTSMTIAAALSTLSRPSYCWPELPPPPSLIISSGWRSTTTRNGTLEYEDENEMAEVAAERSGPLWWLLPSS